MTSKNIHPLPLPEIVLTVGKFIPPWIPGNEDSETVCVILRFLALTLSGEYYCLQVEKLQLNCTRIQEAKPDLRLLHWQWAGPHDNDPQDLKILFLLRQLRQLRTIPLDNWGLNLVQLHRILHNNANNFEEIRLGCWDYTSSFLRKSAVNLEWSGLETASPGSLQATEEQKLEVAILIQGQHSLRLLKVKSLELQFFWSQARIATITFFSTFSALEALTLGYVDDRVGTILAQVLKGCCPNIRFLQNTYLQFESPFRPPHEPDGMAFIVETCAPGKLDHVALGQCLFDEVFRDALLVHRDSLEVLELTLYIQETSDALENIRKVLEVCMRLKRVVLRNCRRSYKVEDASIILEGLRSIASWRV
ncbi:hypothetical protein BGZ47_009911 [Haplosporangium gracile]|nr:hypothetical protein BGZ47_009911 [Haplosporangium gracile]